MGSADFCGGQKVLQLAKDGGLQLAKDGGGQECLMPKNFNFPAPHQSRPISEHSVSRSFSQEPEKQEVLEQCRSLTLATS